MTEASQFASRAIATIGWVILVAIFFYSVMVVFNIGEIGADAHSWYPPECCHDRDCFPADKVTPLPDGALEVQANGKTIIVPFGFPRRASRDGSYHICFRWYGNEAGENPIIHCFFEPGNS